MFTGIVEEIGTLRSSRDSGGKRYPVISASNVLTGLKVGDSVACDGICLTVTAISTDCFTVEIMRETLLKTTATNWRTGQQLNLERAMPANGRFDGHIVQGHVDTISRLLRRSEIDGTLYLEFELPTSFRELIVDQGSIAVNGVSLTVARLTMDSFAVALIGTTREATNLGALRSGVVNLEFDIIGKYLQRRMRILSAGITEKSMKEMGF
jgi:riboflavin synthase